MKGKEVNKTPKSQEVPETYKIHKKGGCLLSQAACPVCWERHTHSVCALESMLRQAFQGCGCVGVICAPVGNPNKFTSCLN